MAATNIDRTKTVPFLLRLFYKQGTLQRPDDFHPEGPLPPHLQIYTWYSCSLRELTNLITSTMPHLVPSPVAGTRLVFRLFYPDARPGGPPVGRFTCKELGSVVIDSSPDEANGSTNGRDSAMSLEGEADKTLSDARFIIGDYVSCSVYPPLRDGSAAPNPTMRDPWGPSQPRGGFRDGYSGGYASRTGSRSRYSDYSRAHQSTGMPSGEWRKGERLPDGPGAYRRGRGGRGRGW